MRWIKDTTGRFPERPYYPLEELDDLSESWIVGFLVARYGTAEFPVSTEDLTVMIESDTSDLDQFADLTSEEADGEELQGMTVFYPDKRPAVKISQQIASQNQREHRFRTTLTHEFGHVKLHGGLWQFQQLSLFPNPDPEPGPRCKRAEMLNAPRTDWMEWQAGYVSGAILMPITSLKELVHEVLREWDAVGSIGISSSDAMKLQELVAARFGVSIDATRVRLAQLGFLTGGSRGSSMPLT